ncbi:histidine--tRNA ligase [Bacteriovorax sp. DB6_IX]|uniref:histidine--tRNA ligase n=1 Tax=Bacteriovorax sp. DB6_IX TaxID=1353530 RepID=UPI00038A1BB8|nr:histidine--tRNA ligase [Bacteriovorax sp. DB6_IX]EQC43102.1 histidine--tRNA ligase [Bacteriovorax sp. DB6_IX]
MSVKPQNAKGTRDFGPVETNRRNYIFDTIKKHFKAHGFMPLETPAVENLDVLTGKYGEEGDKLLFKILNSGDYLKKVSDEQLQSRDARSMTRKISDRGLKYDLTVPFARYVAKNQNELAFPFKRFQIQPVWRADRPQKGRYREFYQCDADIIGTDSLLSEVSLMQIYNDSLIDLGIEGFSIKINNRKILQGFASKIGALEKLTDMTIAIDKLDKIGKEKVFEELRSKDFTEDQLTTLDPLFSLSGSNTEKLAQVKEVLSGDEIGEKGVAELEFIFKYTDELGLKTLDFDATLARGLDYYTGAIFEVKLDDGSMGSIGAGGRYDDLTSLFGVKDLSGVGLSFGAARIYDVMEARGLFKNIDSRLDALFINFSDNLTSQYLKLATELRREGFSTDIYPQAAKMKKQMNYANKRGVRYTIFLGESEAEAGIVKVKNMDSGEDREVKISEIKDNLSF